MESKISTHFYANSVSAPVLMPGDFVCVRADHEDPTRVGMDGLVLAVDGDTAVLTFRYDRSNRPLNAICVGPEEWSTSELDLTTVDRNTLLTSEAPAWQRWRATAH
jgi:hypothetical protein